MKRIFTTFEIANLCHVDMTTVINWIEEGKLRAYRTPGGHRRIKRESFVKFLQRFNMPLPDEFINEKKKKVLIVDDEQVVVEVISRFLKKMGYELESAFNGFEAGRKIETFSPGIVILDINLPGTNGIEVCKEIKNKNKDIKVIALTGYPSKENRKRMLKAGADTFLSKPIDLRVLEKVLLTL